MWTWMFTFTKSFKHNKIIKILIYFISEKKRTNEAEEQL